MLHQLIKPVFLKAASMSMYKVTYHATWSLFTTFISCSTGTLVEVWSASKVDTPLWDYLQYWYWRSVSLLSHLCLFTLLDGSRYLSIFVYGCAVMISWYCQGLRLTSLSCALIPDAEKKKSYVAESSNLFYSVLVGWGTLQRLCRKGLRNSTSGGPQSS